MDEHERWTSVWVGDSIAAKPRLDALSLMNALVARRERVDCLGVLDHPSLRATDQVSGR